MIIVGVLLCWLHTILALLVVNEEDCADTVVDVVVVVVVVAVEVSCAASWVFMIDGNLHVE
eukprot:COSAG05_NODE_13298_length_435_cov_0.726190_1_plen_60_part_01